MATRSNIAYCFGPNKYKMIYVHWDGYVQNNGAVLLHHYADPAKVRKLIKLGALSILGKEIGEKQSFDHPTDGWCLAYGRDREEKNTTARDYSSIKDMIEDMEQYLYVFYPETKSWKVISRAFPCVLADLTEKALDMDDDDLFRL